jgi:group II intron reverse transcriptase/maturase
LGIAALEDKVVQHAVGTVLNQIWEEDFKGFSYGFRAGRGQHDALDALYVGITRKKVNWIIDLDIRSFFDKIGHDWMIQFVEHRIGDKRIVRLIQKWLKAGVMDDGKWFETEEGTPQGSVISPILANLYLHYVLDVWVKVWREKLASGEMIVVRYADDAVLGFQQREDAERFLEQLRERLRKFGLTLHPDKTRLIEFGRFAADRRKRRGEGKPETFNFLAFHPHLWDEQQDGVLCGATKDNRQTDGSQAEGHWAKAAGADARGNREHGGVAEVCGSGLFPISRHCGQ